MSEAKSIRDFGTERFKTEATIGAFELIQTPEGQAGVLDRNTALPVDDYGKFTTVAQWMVAKAVTFKALKGGRAYWDHSANALNYKKVNDRDFYAGRFAEDAESTANTCVLDLNIDPRYDIDLLRDGYDSVITSGHALQAGVGAKVGGTAGFVVNAADNLPYVATLAASQSLAKLVIPIYGLQIGDTITGFRFVAQVESAGGTVTIDGDLRATTNVAADPTDASIGAMTQQTLSADTAVSVLKDALAEVVASGKTYYLLVTGSTAAATDIIVQACEVYVTRAGGSPAMLRERGGALELELTPANQAQKVDALSIDGFDTVANAIVELIFRVVSDGAGTTPDVSLGVANGTHATDASSIAERLFCHLDGNSTNINFESADGVSAAVAITDSTKDYTEGSAVANRAEVWLDFRDPADVQVYVDGVNVLAASVFDVDAAVGPWKLLAHLEKTAAADTYRVAIDRLCVRYAEQ